jgi:ribosomal protein S27E
MKSIEEHNKERINSFTVLEKVETGIQCPQCGDELLETSPGTLLMSNPPQKNVHCPACKYQSYIIA